MRKLGESKWASGYVLTGRKCFYARFLDLADDILHENVRVATPDILRVREPQYYKWSWIKLKTILIKKLNYVGKIGQKKAEHFETVPAPAPRRVHSNPPKQKTRNSKPINNQNDDRMMFKS